MSILDQIVRTKYDEVKAAKQILSQRELEATCASLEPTRPFVACFEAPQDGNRCRIIAEIKKASPSAGVIRSSFDPIAIAEAYAAGGATALSVLTDQTYFQGDLLFLKQIKSHVSLPLLRKDFIVDPYQIYEARASGADAILLIARLLPHAVLQDYLACANAIGLDVLIEVHTVEEAVQVSKMAGRYLLGVNNRDLSTFTVSLEISRQIAATLPKPRAYPLISESGLKTRNDLLALTQLGFDGFLIGESLMREEDLTCALRAFVGE